MGTLGQKEIKHGIEKQIGGLSVDDVAELRDRIRLGDILNYPRLVRDRNAAGALAERWRRVHVTGIYPHLVTVKGRGTEYPLQTITYTEMLTDSRIMSGR